MQTNQETTLPINTRPTYPVTPITAAEANGELLFSYGRLFTRGSDGRWHVVDDFGD